MPFLRKYNTAITAGTAQSVKIPLIKRGVVDFAVSADWTPAAGDVKVSKDGGAAANIATLPSAVTMGNTAYWEFVFSAAELSCGTLVVTVADSATKAVEDQSFIIETYGNASALYQWDMSLANVPANVTQLLGTAWLTPAVAGTPDVNAKQIGGQASSLNANNLLKVSLNDILATALTETSGQLTAGFKKFFNVATPTSTMNEITLVDTVTTVSNQLTAAAIATGIWQDATAGDFTTSGSIGKSLFTSGAVPGAAGGLFIAGTNAATTITTALTTTFTGSLTGSVASVTGAAGSVTGAVGSVTGNVGGNVTGSVGSISGITFPSNFGDMSITVTTGRVTVGTNNDKAGYSISGSKTTLDALNDITAASVWAVATRVLTAGTNIVLAKGTGVTGFNDVTAAAVRDVDNSSPASGSLGEAARNADAKAAVLIDTLGTPAGATIAADLAEIEAETDGIAAIPTTNPTAAQVAAAVLTTQMTESYPSLHAVPTLAQAILMVLQFLLERSISSTTETIKKVDGSTTAYTETLNDATSPTARTRAT